MTEPHQHVVFIVAVAITAIAAWYDWRKGEIPNWLTFPVIAAGPFLNIARYVAAHRPFDAAIQEGGYSLGGAALCALVPLMLYRQGAIGGGDVKLLVAIGALLQPTVGVEAQMYGFFAGAILAPGMLAYEGKLFTSLKNAFAIGGNLFLPKGRQRTIDASALSWFRLGPAILVGVVFAAYLHW
jgi:prepilin peptidase CpaA